MEGGFMWGPFRFTPVRRVPPGWQCTCLHPRHESARGSARCTKSRVYHDDDGEELAIRFLKWWALEGLELDSKEAHQRIRVPPVRDIPEMAELDDRTPAEFPL